MVVGVFGLPRSGKTTFAAKLNRDAQRGRSLRVGYGNWRVNVGDFAPYLRVYSNFPLPGALRLDFDDLGRYKVDNSLILIDEISLCCDARNYKEFKQHTKEFFALHGHYRDDVVFLSQGWEDADKRIRNLTEVLLYVDRWGRFSRVRPIRKTWSIDGTITEGYTLAPPLSSSWIYRPRYYGDFDSFAVPDLPPMAGAEWFPA